MCQGIIQTYIYLKLAELQLIAPAQFLALIAELHQSTGAQRLSMIFMNHSNTYLTMQHTSILIRSIFVLMGPVVAPG